MKKLIIFFLLSITLFLYNNTYALESNSSLIKAYNSFLLKLEKRFEAKDQLIILNKVKIKLDTTFKTKKLSTKSIILLKELNNLNNLEIQNINNRLNKNYYIDNSQIEIEKQEIEKFKNLTKIELPNYISKILSENISFINTIYNEKNFVYEFLDSNKIKGLIFNRYLEINEDNYKLFKDKKWYIIINKWKYIFLENYEIEEKIPYSEWFKYFKSVMTNTKASYYLKNWIYYYYKFDKYTYIQDNYWFYQSFLITLWLNPKDNILLKNWNEYVYVNNYTENKLLNSETILNITNKDLFLSFVFDDKKTLNYETDNYFQELKTNTENLTKWLSKEDKIKKIYNYILENIIYSNPVDLNKKQIFSWIDTYKNKDWVCEWYAKLMAYMLMLSWIEDIEVLRWFVINAPDFPKVWHAWIKIWDYYYDPTFDDPIWNTSAKKFDQYVYFKLPWDLFYTNRYDYTNLPEEIKTETPEQLTLIVNKNLYNLINKYKNSGYNIMKYPLMLSKNWLSYNDKINIISLKKMLSTYEINWVDMSFTKNWKKTYIKKLKYYKLEDSTIEDLLKNINYDLTNKSIFKWNFWDWKYEYRLIYELEVY